MIAKSALEDEMRREIKAVERMRPLIFRLHMIRNPYYEELTGVLGGDVEVGCGYE